GDVPTAQGPNALQGKTIRTDAVSRPACAGGCEGGAAEMPGKPGRTPVPVYGDRRVYTVALSGSISRTEHLFFRRFPGENGGLVPAPRCAGRVCADRQRY